MSTAKGRIEELPIDDATVDAIASFIELLAPPSRAPVDPALETQGEALFGTLGCASCHVPELRTADGLEVRAYTDLLLHRVTVDAIGIEQGEAGINDFRTPPLWGLRATAPYLHDGRAHSIEAAIAGHDGEARAARSRYEDASGPQRAALLAFLESL